MSDLDQDEIQAQAEREKNAREKTIREQMEARGYNPDNATERARYEELQTKAEAGRITQQDVHRGMETLTTEERDRQRRDEQTKQQEQGRKQEEKEKPLDWERMLSDPVYRKQMEQQTREERRAELERTGERQGPTRPVTTGRER